MNTRRFPRTTEEAWPTEADRTGMHYYRRGPSYWPGLLAINAVLMIVLAVLLYGCTDSYADVRV